MLPGLGTAPQKLCCNVQPDEPFVIVCVRVSKKCQTRRSARFWRFSFEFSRCCWEHALTQWYLCSPPKSARVLEFCQSAYSEAHRRGTRLYGSHGLVIQYLHLSGCRFVHGDLEFILHLRHATLKSLRRDDDVSDPSWRRPAPGTTQALLCRTVNSIIQHHTRHDVSLHTERETTKG